MKNMGKQIKTIPTQYDPAETVEQISKELITKYHTSLIQANIAYLFINKSIIKNNRECLATAEKCSSKIKALCNKDFIIVVSYPLWLELTDNQKFAVIDHELTHCLVDEDKEGNMLYKIVPHDIEEFLVILDRYKLYKNDLILLGRVVKNLDNESNP